MLYKENKNILVWRELHKTYFENKTAVFWLHIPFAVHLLVSWHLWGWGGNPGIFFLGGEQGENTGYRRVKSKSREDQNKWENPILVLSEVCTAHPADPRGREFPSQKNPSWAFGLSMSCVTAEGKWSLRCSHIPSLFPKPEILVLLFGEKNIFGAGRKKLQRSVWVRKCPTHH